MKVKVIVTPKKAVLDPQGAAVRDAMRHLGMPEVRDVRIGKYLEIDVDGEDGDLEQRLHALCRDLLSNPVIEDYELESEDGSQKSEVGGRRTEAGKAKQTSNAQRSMKKR
jgi:phosphoribosylformylglycinamidine synthase